MTDVHFGEMSNSERVLIRRCHRSLRFAACRRYNSYITSPGVVLKFHSDVVGSFSIHYFPYVDNNVALPSALKGPKTELI